MKQLFLAACVFAAAITKTYAVRPFITDDAAVVGHKLLQLETWTIFNKYEKQHWSMLAYGPSDKLEVAVGTVWGYDRTHSEFSLAAPLLEAKYLFREYETGRPPGVALIAGTFLPFGQGNFVEEAYGAYAFAALTQCFGSNEDLLIHGNLGLNYLNTQGEKFIPFWGLGTQVRAYKGIHLVGEIMSGDPYVPGTGLTYQAGLRYFVSDLIQLDATVGEGIAGKEKLPFWWGFGLRLVMASPAKKPHKATALSATSYHQTHRGKR